MFGKGGWVVGEGTGLDIVGIGGVELLFVFGDKRFVEAVEGIDIGHHSGWAVNNGEMVSKKCCRKTHADVGGSAHLRWFTKAR